jgi:Zn-dependent protease with chaperone function
MQAEANNESLSQPYLAYDRIEKNRRETKLLITAFIVLVLPTLAFLVEYGAVWLAMASTTVLWHVKDEHTYINVMFILGGIVFFVLVLIAILKYLSAADSVLHTVEARSPIPDESEFIRIVENLCIGAGLPMPKLYVVDAWVPNAFSVGFSPDRASLIVTKGLLNLLDRRELEGVIAHELSHIGNRDSQINTVLAVILRTLNLPFPIQVILWAGLVFSLPVLFFDMNFLSDFPPIARLLIELQTILLAWTLLWPWVGRFVQRSISRKREFLADADASLLTRYPEGLARALTKISSAIQVGGVFAKRESAKLAPSVLSHLFLVTPVAMLDMFDPHPPAAVRVAVLARMGSGITPSTLERAAAAGAEYFRNEASLRPTKQKAQEDLYWLDQVPGMFKAGVNGIKYGLISMFSFFSFTCLLLIMLFRNISTEELHSSIISSSIMGYAVAGYIAAKSFAPEHRFALLGSCIILYFFWLFAMVLVFGTDSVGTQDMTAKFMLLFIGGTTLVVVGGACGSMVQAAFTSKLSPLFWSSRLRKVRNNYAYIPYANSSSSVENTTYHNIDIPAPEHRKKCPKCDAVMADTDEMCVWCGYKLDQHS